MDHLLDDPIWNALTTRQASLARKAGGIRRFPAEFGPFAATADGTAESFAGLAELTAQGEQIYLPRTKRWRRQRDLSSFTPCRSCKWWRPGSKRSDGLTFAELTSDDAPEMRALAQQTRPGPFAERSTNSAASSAFATRAG